MWPEDEFPDVTDDNEPDLPPSEGADFDGEVPLF